MPKSCPCTLLAKLEPSNCLKSVAVALHTEERLRAVHDRCWALCWHHSGKLFASCGEDRTVKVWQCVELPEDNASNSSSSGGGGAIDDDGSDTNTKLKLLCTLRGDQTRSIRSVAFSPCGRFLASASFDATVVVYEQQQQNEDGDGGAGGGVLEFEELHRLEGHESEVKCVAFSASGEQLATCSRDKSVWVWQVDDNGDYEVASILQHHTADVKFVLWHPRDELLVSGGYDGSIRFYAFDGDDWITAQLKDAHEETVWSAAFEPTTGDHLATVGTDRTIRIWRRSSSMSVGDQCTWQKVVEHPLLLTTRWPLYTIAWAGSSAQNAASGGILAVGGGDCFVRLFSFDQDMDALVTLSALRMDSEVNSVSWRTTAKSAHKHWQQLAVALDSGHIHLLQLQQNEKDGSGGGEKGKRNLP